MKKSLGIDVGGSGIKGAIVDVDNGVFIGERHRIPTPQPATPMAVAETIKAILAHFEWSAPFGVGLPAVVQQGVARSAANIHNDWIGTDASALLEEVTGCPALVLNDADAAGVAEINHGAGFNRSGTLMMLTLGTGIGSALFVDGRLVPNTELGHLNVGEVEAEIFASDAARKRDDLDWPEWAARLDKVLGVYRDLFWPECFILGGGVSKKHKKFIHLLKVETPVIPAELLNGAGIIGAAMAVS